MLGTDERKSTAQSQDIVTWKAGIVTVPPWRTGVLNTQRTKTTYHRKLVTTTRKTRTITHHRKNISRENQTWRRNKPECPLRTRTTVRNVNARIKTRTVQARKSKANCRTHRFE